MTVSYHDAAIKATVRLPSGQTGTLRYVPEVGHKTRRGGARAKVELPSGAWVSVPPDDLEVLTDCEDLCMEQCQGPCGVLPV